MRDSRHIIYLRRANNAHALRKTRGGREGNVFARRMPKMQHATISARGGLT